MVRTSHSIRRAVEALASREPAFARVVEKHGVPEPRNSERGAQTLLRTIVGQQVSVAAARSMWAKLEAAFGSPPDLHKLLAATDEELRAAGMSRQKSGYIRSLAELVISGELDLENLPRTMRKRSRSSPRSRASAAGRRKSTCCLPKAAATYSRPATSPYWSRSAG